MFIHKMLYAKIVVSVILVISVAKLSKAVIQPRPDCQTTCGNLTIPFPFGISPECYLNERFLINCDTTTNTTFYLQGQSEEDVIQVLNITSDGQMRVNSFISGACLNASGELVTVRTGRLDSSVFTISNSKNRFTAVGCSTLAIFLGFSTSQSNRNMRSCASSCLDIGAHGVVNGSCLGNGCCQSTLPERLISFSPEFRNIGTYAGQNPYRCSYPFVVENGEYNFSSADLNDMQGRHVMPVVLDWAVGFSNCTVAKTDPTEYACRDINSYCSDSKGPSGYICNCISGFTGNPYLFDGCVDIDECRSFTDPCPRGYECRNSIGSYTCSCPDSYEEIDGIACRKRDKKRPSLILIGLGVGSGTGMIVLAVGIWFTYKQSKRRRKINLRKKFFKRNGGLLLKEELSARKGPVEKTRLFTAKDLDRATDHYNKNRILGHGGQGTVYKGMLDDGRIVAVKMSKVVDERNLQQFINEVVILSQINHRNIVILHGCCLETEVPLLVYEYIPNGTLSHYICHDNEEFPLSWDVRLRIASEAATALSYLHTSASVPIYHRDIKSENILLDDKYRAKVADFGTSRSISIDQTHLTTQVIGTFGYLDPEYFQSSQFTDKSDVYSFGVILVELLTSQKAVSLKISGEGESLVTNFMYSMRENRLYDILAARVIEEGPKAEIERVANLARQSLNLNGRKRPTMNDVARELESIRMSSGCSKKNEEDEYIIDEVDYQWEMTRTTSSFLDGKSSVVSSFDVQPFLYNTV